MSDPSNPFASPQAVAVERPEVVWAAEHPEALRKVKVGLTLVYTGICGILLCMVGMFPLMLLAGGQAGMVIIVLLGLAFVAFVIAMFVGQIFCVAVPAESGAKPLAIAAVVLGVVSVLAGLLGAVTSMSVNVLVVMAFGQNLANLASVVCFLLFLRKVALYIERPDVASRAVRTLIVGILSTIAMVIGAATEVMPLGQGAAMSGVMLVGSLGMLVSFVMYANTVTYLRKAITV